MIDFKQWHVNRDISWLHFNERVLQEAADKTVPLISRLRFVGIFSDNLDEFFRVRYATIRRIAEADHQDFSELHGQDPTTLLKEITEIVINQQTQSLKVLEDIKQELKRENIFIINETEVTDKQKQYLFTYFKEKVSSSLFTIILNELEKVSDLRDSSGYLAVKIVLKDEDPGGQHFFLKKKDKHKYALIEISKSVKRFIVLPPEDGKNHIILVDDLIRLFIHKIFSLFDYKSISAHMIKISRDAELDMDNDIHKSFMDKIYNSVTARTVGDPVRFVYDQTIEKDTLNFLLDKLGIGKTDSVIPGGRYHNRSSYLKFPELGRADLVFEPMPPLPIKDLEIQGSILKKLNIRDYLQFTPYHTFSYIIRFLREVALDPAVKTVSITVYRLADVSQVVNSLINASKNGKKVRVLVEFQARFDEEANIKHAEQLEAEGVEVMPSIPGLKVHSKICVVERQEQDKIRLYGFISTGNFNENTAQIYTDYTLFTASQKILRDVQKIFKFLGASYMVQKYKHLIVSPHYTKNEFCSLIDKEIKHAKEQKPAYIKLKMNSLTNERMIQKLYEASQAGVKIQMVIRGVCCLIPGIEGLSENIEIISIVDRFLEHTRLYIFCNNDKPKIYISSADWMTRNLDHRVEVSCPIYKKKIRKELIDTFEIAWSDNVKARIFSPDNSYRATKDPAVRSQLAIYEYYKNQV